MVERPLFLCFFVINYNRLLIHSMNEVKLLLTKDILQWVVSESDTFPVSLNNLMYVPNEVSNDPNLVFEIGNFDTGLGEIAIWDTGDALFSLFFPNASDGIYQKAFFHFVDDFKTEFLLVANQFNKQ